VIDTRAHVVAPVPVEGAVDVAVLAPTAGTPTRVSGTWSRRTSALVALALLAAAALFWVALVVAGSDGVTVDLLSPAAPSSEPSPALTSLVGARPPRGVYVLIDTEGSRLRLYRGGELLREAVVSTGSGTLLRDPRDGREWVFDTPLGERRVLRKVKDPVWRKPDWAFVEQGLVPPASWRERTDDVSLGDYALDLGAGYLIHGTLFQTLLGQPVTHGCIRVGDADLEYLYRHVPLGAPVYLY
jgi:L,D-transpeptidase YbiS